MGVMPKINVIDEAVIDSLPMVVYKAILNEYAGSHVGGCLFLNPS